MYLSVRLTHFKEATDYFVTSYLIIDAINHKLYNPITSNPFTALKWSPTGHSYIFTQPAYFLRDSNETTAFHYCDGNDMNKTLDLGEILGIDSINYSYANISPDGKKIMVVYSEYVMPTIMEIEKYTIAILNTDGTGLKVIPDKEIIYGVKPIFSADSKYIYYFTKHQGKDLFVKYDLAHKKYSNFMLFNTDLEWYDLSLTKDGYLEAHSMVSGTNDTPTKYITLILDIEKQELVSVLAESK